MAETIERSRVGDLSLTAVVSLAMTGFAAPAIFLQRAGFGPETTIVAFGAVWIVILGRGRVPGVAWRLVSPVLLLCLWGLAIAATNRNVTKVAAQLLLVLGIFGGTVIVGAVAAKTDGRRLLPRLDRYMQFTGVLASGLLIAGVLKLIGTAARGTAILALLPLAWLLAARQASTIRKRPVLIVVLLAAIGLSNARTALAVGLLLVVLSTPARTIAQRARLVLVLAAVGYGAWWLAFHWAPLRSHLFTGDTNLTIGGVAINGNGRLSAWQLVYDDWNHDKIIGRGPGSADRLVQTKLPSVGLTHNDYLRVLHDFGFVGCAIWLVMMFRLFHYLRRRERGRPMSDQLARRIDMTARLTFVAIAVVMASDNVLLYGFVLAPAGTLLGLSVGLRSKMPESVLTTGR